MVDGIGVDFVCFDIFCNFWCEVVVKERFVIVNRFDVN